MKLAKKVFATVMAVAMIFALSAIAFAAAPTVSLVAGEVKDGQVKVSVYFDDAIGLKSWDINVKYDAAVLQFKSISKGADAKQCDGLANNSFTSENNPGEAGVVKYSGYFKENLWTAEQFAADAADPDEEPVNINAEHFHAATITFTVIKADAASTDLTVEVTKGEGADITGGSAKIVIAGEQEPASSEEPSSSEEPTKEEPTKEEPTKEEPTKDDASSETASVEEASKTPGKDVGPKTDASNWMIGAAAAVAVLAGAAFVVSKKRK